MNKIAALQNRLELNFAANLSKKAGLPHAAECCLGSVQFPLPLSLLFQNRIFAFEEKVSGIVTRYSRRGESDLRV